MTERLDHKQIANEMRRTAQVMRNAGHPDIADGNEQIAEYIEGLECGLAAERKLSKRRTSERDYWKLRAHGKTHDEAGRKTDD